MFPTACVAVDPSPMPLSRIWRRTEHRNWPDFVLENVFESRLTVYDCVRAARLTFLGLNLRCWVQPQVILQTRWHRLDLGHSVITLWLCSSMRQKLTSSSISWGSLNASPTIAMGSMADRWLELYWAWGSDMGKMKYDWVLDWLGFTIWRYDHVAVKLICIRQRQTIGYVYKRCSYLWVELLPGSLYFDRRMNRLCRRQFHQTRQHQR